MEQPSRKKGQDTRDRILDAAEDVFYEKGYFQTALNEIAQVAGMTRGAIYWNFKNKEDVFNEMCNRVRKLMMDLVVDASERDDGNPIEALKQTQARITREIVQNSRFRKVLTIILLRCEYTHEMNRVRVQMLEWRRYTNGLLEEALTGAQKKRLLPQDLDIRMMVDMLRDSYWGMVRDWLFDPTQYELEERARKQELVFFEMFRESAYLRKR